MTATNKHPIFFKSLSTIEDAKALLTYLYDNGLSYHCEDSAADCIGDKVSAEECEALDVRLNEAYSFDWGKSCPCGFVLELDPDTLRNQIAELDVNDREEIERLQALLAERDTQTSAK